MSVKAHTVLPLGDHLFGPWLRKEVCTGRVLPWNLMGFVIVAEVVCYLPYFAEHRGPAIDISPV